MLTRRSFVLATGTALASAALPFGASAEDYPTRPVTWVIPYGAGSASDLTARLLVEKVSPIIGERMLVENRQGGSGLVGTEYVLSADPDGYTLILGSNSTHAVDVTLFKNLNYDPLTDFSPVALLTSQPQVIVVHPSVGVTTIPELVEYAEANPGALNFASTGVGTGAHLAPMTFKTMADIDVVHVPYPGGGKAIPDLIAGRVQLMFYPYLPLQGFIESGQLVPLATTGYERVPWLPDLPTMIELGYDDFTFPSWYCVLGPKGMPEAVVTKLSDAFQEVLADPEVVASLADKGTVPMYEEAAGLQAFLASEIERYKGIITAAGIEKIDN